MLLGVYRKTNDREWLTAALPAVEKYDLVRRTSDVSSGVRFGYSSNERGFGRTNAVFQVLTDELGKRGVN